VGEDIDSVESLADFRRFPAWMWRNADVLDFVGWLRDHNDRLPEIDRTGFYGLDLYSLYTSIEAVLRYLDRVDPEAAKRARQRYACFERFGTDEQAYGWATSLGLTRSCEDDVVRQLVELQQHAQQYARMDGRLAADEAFFAQQNARLVKNAEQYYRAMFGGAVESWNLRDQHMADTLDALAAHLAGLNGQAKVVVWEHNSHVGDARATQMGAEGEWNVGQIVRERHGDRAVLAGFTTYSGTVTAASNWGGPAERKRARPALPGSCEALFHEVDIPGFLLTFGSANAARATTELRQPRLERAIGVVYLPETERLSHYFYARLADQFDAVIHIDETRAVEPLERTSVWERGEVPETYPSAL
jgi:erythromycin esterase-like protein